MIDPAVDLGEEVPVAADEIRLDLEPECQVGAMAGLGDPADPVDGLLQILLGAGPLGRIKREPADELGLEGMGQITGPGHILGEVRLEGDVGILRAVVDVVELDLADRGGDRGDVEPVAILEVPDLLDLRHRQLHDVLDPLADVDEPQGVILQADRRERRELLDGRQFEGRFVGEGREENGAGLGHGGDSRGRGAIEEACLQQRSAAAPGPTRRRQTDGGRSAPEGCETTIREEIPPRGVKWATRVIRRGATTATRSSRMQLVTFS